MPIVLVRLPSLPSADLAYLLAYRLHCTFPASRCISVCHEEFSPVFASRTWEWLREVELHPPLVRTVHFFCGHPSWLPLDPEPSYMGYTHSWAAKGNFGSRCVWFTLRNRTLLSKACQEVVLSIFLYYPVRITLLLPL
jgi:hypothetical protein